MLFLRVLFSTFHGQNKMFFLKYCSVRTNKLHKTSLKKMKKLNFFCSKFYLLSCWMTPIDNQYIDFESTFPPEFEMFWRNKTETKYVRLVSTFFCESKVFTGVLKFPLLSLFFWHFNSPRPTSCQKGCDSQALIKT